jgi:hypothetical protein
MLRRIPAVAVCAAMLAAGALPASAAPGHVRAFSIPGVYGVRAWGTFDNSGTKIQVTVCVEDNSRSVYGAVAVGLAFDSGYRHHDNVSTVTIGYNHIQCRAMVTRYTSHLVVEASSGNRNGSVRQHGRPRRVY